MAAKLTRVTRATMAVLGVLVTNEEDLYGWQIVERTGRESGTIYPILSRLQRAGWVVGYWESKNARHPGPRRRFFRLTDDGRHAASELLSHCQGASDDSQDASNVLSAGVQPRSRQALEAIDDLLSELHLLRRQAGNPSLYEIARRAGRSLQTVAGVFATAVLPDLETMLVVVRTCGGDEQEWATRWDAAARVMFTSADTAIEWSRAAKPAQPEATAGTWLIADSTIGLPRHEPPGLPSRDAVDADQRPVLNPAVSDVEFRLLGPVEIWVNNLPIPAGWATQRQALAVLLMARGRLVPTDVLLQQLWGDAPPSRARDILYTYISRLRRILDQTRLGGRSLTSRDGGYRLAIHPQHVDVHRFYDLVARARPVLGQDDPRAVLLLREALNLWRGTPLAGLNSRWADSYRITLRTEHQSVLVTCLEAELRLGRHDQIIGELTELNNLEPLDERVAGLLMLAFYRSGRQADALAVYHRSRAALTEELGVEPSREIDDLHVRILHHDDSLTAPSVDTR